MADGGFPGEERETQPTVLVSGQARALLRRVPLQLLAERAVDGDGAVIATTRDDPAVVARRLCGALDAFEPGRVAVVDATSKDEAAPNRVESRRWNVPSPVAFGHVRTAVVAARDALAERGADRVHLLFETLTTQFRLADAEMVQGYARDLAMVAGGERGLGLFTVEPSVVTDREFERLKHLLDVHVGVRRTTGGPVVRWTGLVGRSDGWVPLADAGFRFDALGKSVD